MKKMACCITSAMFAGAAGIALYAFMNKDTKKNADKLLNTMMEDVNDAMKKMKQETISFFMYYFDFL